VKRKLTLSLNAIEAMARINPADRTTFFYLQKGDRIDGNDALTIEQIRDRLLGSGATAEKAKEFVEDLLKYDWADLKQPLVTCSMHSGH
jgi:hypothetical protein